MAANPIDLKLCPVLMLDMNGTFMFGQDRFGPEQDYFSTYRQLGGRELSQEVVSSIISKFVDLMGSFYVDPNWYDAFPSVADVLRNPKLDLGFGNPEMELLEEVIAHHELGNVPEDQTVSLQRLAKTHRLILVSNIWSSTRLWIEHLKATEVLDAFDAVVFSSEHGCIKPGRRIFEIALEYAQVPPNKVVFIGDDPECDVTAPRGLGMSTIRVVGTRKQIERDADWVVGHLSEILC